MNKPPTTNAGAPTRPAVRFAWALAGVAVLLTVVSGLCYAAVVLTMPDSGVAGAPDASSTHQMAFQLSRTFDVGAEATIAAWFSTVLWALPGCAASAAAGLATRRQLGWMLFGLVAAVASADEATQLHELLDWFGDPISDSLGWNVQFSWVIPGTLVAAVTALLMWPLVRSLPRRSRNLLLLGGAVFLFGALVLETISGQIIVRYGVITWHQQLVTHFEELCEMLGLILALTGVARLFVLIPGPERRWRFRFDEDADEDAAASPGARAADEQAHR